MPNDSFLLELLKNFDYVYASSANITSESPVTSLEEAFNVFWEEGRNDIFFADIEKRNVCKKASTVFDYDNLKILREGDIGEREILTLVRRN